MTGHQQSMWNLKLTCSQMISRPVNLFSKHQETFGSVWKLGTPTPVVVHHVPLQLAKNWGIQTNPFVYVGMVNFWNLLKTPGWFGDSGDKNSIGPKKEVLRSGQSIARSRWLPLFGTLPGAAWCRCLFFFFALVHFARVLHGDPGRWNDLGQEYRINCWRIYIYILISAYSIVTNIFNMI